MQIFCFCNKTTPAIKTAIIISNTEMYRARKMVRRAMGNLEETLNGPKKTASRWAKNTRTAYIQARNEARTQE